MYAVINTETSGLFDFSKPADAEGQPRLAHLCMIFVDADLKEEGVADYLIKPEGWTMTPEAEKINHLSTALLMEKGVSIVNALSAYATAIDEGRIIVAFNAQFDTKVMRGEMRRSKIDDRFERTPNICVMRPLTEICAIPKAKGKGFKFPKLSEAMAHFKIEQSGAHLADGDARAALELFRVLRKIGACPEPSVHFAKETLQNDDRPASRFATA